MIVHFQFFIFNFINTSSLNYREMVKLLNLKLTHIEITFLLKHNTLKRLYNILCQLNGTITLKLV